MKTSTCLRHEAFPWKRFVKACTSRLRGNQPREIVTSVRHSVYGKTETFHQSHPDSVTIFERVRAVRHVFRCYAIISRSPMFSQH